MKLVRFSVASGQVLCGVVRDEHIVEFAQANIPFADLHAVIEGGDTALDMLRTRLAASPDHYALSDVRLLAPLPKPAKFLAIGMNYQKHLEESVRIGVPPPKKQVWFNKQTSCINGPFDDIDPGVTEQLDYEVELGVVIGRPAKTVRAQDALRHIFGYMVVNDVSARDWQFHSPTFTVGKSFDTHGPTGPWIVTKDEVPDCHDLALRCSVNGQVRQKSNTGLMIHNVYEQIEYLSTAFTLQSGDILSTGTPEGVGVGMTPPSFLKEGDVVRCEIDLIGAIVNRVVSTRR